MPESQKPRGKTLREQADDIATSYVVSMNKVKPYADEDEMIEEKRMLREDILADLEWMRERYRY